MPSSVSAAEFPHYHKQLSTKCHQTCKQLKLHFKPKGVYQLCLNTIPF